jgi:two-component system, OmpR family, sensor kinase
VTVRVRLGLVYTMAIVFTIGIVGIVVWWQMAAALRASLDQTLATRATAALSGIENDGQYGLQEGDSPGPPGVFLAIFDAQGNLVDATAGAPTGLVAPTHVGASDVMVGTGTYATYDATSENGLRVVAGSTLDGVRATLDRLAWLLALVGGAAAAASLIGGWWLAGRALHPVAVITSEASQIGAADIERRLPIPGQRDELSALATTLNAMLDRVTDALRKQRRFVAAAAHDLRMPIAALQAELDLADDERTTPEELRAAVRAAHADTVRLGELATALLDLAAADVDGRALVRTPVRTDALIESVVRRVEPVARERGTSITRSSPGQLIRVDRVRLEQAVINLLINAIRYGPPGAQVGVVAEFEQVAPATNAMSSVLTIEVTDRGPGIPPQLADRLFEPFERGADAREPGTGLGLATAAASVRAHRGSIGFEPRAGGGSRFWIRVPV